MYADDYWANDELQDRLYYASQREKRKYNYRQSNGRFARHHQSLRRFRSRTVLLIFGLLLLVLWWWLASSKSHVKLDWSRFAYSQYATDTQSLCNALMVFERLHKLKSMPDRVLLYPRDWQRSGADLNGRLMQVARQKYGVKLQPVSLIGSDATPESPGTLNKPSDWNLSVTKIRVFELVQYDRVLHLDSDITLLQHMDELFLLPRTPIAMPRAYWSDGPSSSWQLTSLIMLVEPNPWELSAMMETLRQWQAQPDYAQSKKYDMDLLNHRFGASAMVLPHRPYAMLTAEFRSRNHTKYLGVQNGYRLDPRARWDPDRALMEAKLVHFSDWPLPKPWVMWPVQGLAEMQPDCGGSNRATCKEREIWKNLYHDFRRRRKDVCKILSVPAPDWQSWKNSTGAGGSGAATLPLSVA
jgi:hypothetical protein